MATNGLSPKIFIFLLFSLLQLVKIRSQSSAFFAGATRRGGHEMKPWTVGPGASRGPEGNQAMWKLTDHQQGKGENVDVNGTIM